MPDETLGVGAFDARDIASLTTAFDAALLIAHDDGSPFADLPAPELRAWIARSILAAMRRGVRDTHLLTALALRELRHLVLHREERRASASAGPDARGDVRPS